MGLAATAVNAAAEVERPPCGVIRLRMRNLLGSQGVLFNMGVADLAQ